MMAKRGADSAWRLLEETHTETQDLTAEMRAMRDEVDARMAEMSRRLDGLARIMSLIAGDAVQVAANKATPPAE